MRAGSGHHHLQEDVEDCVEGLSVPVSGGNTLVSTASGFKIVLHV